MNVMNSIRSNTHHMQTTKTTQGKRSGLMKVLDSDIVYCSVSKLTLTALRTWVDQQARLGGAHALSSRESSRSPTVLAKPDRGFWLGSAKLGRARLVVAYTRVSLGLVDASPARLSVCMGPLFSCCFCVLFYCFSCFIPCSL